MLPHEGTMSRLICVICGDPVLRVDGRWWHNTDDGPHGHAPRVEHERTDAERERDEAMQIANRRVFLAESDSESVRQRERAEAAERERDAWQDRTVIQTTKLDAAEVQVGRLREERDAAVAALRATVGFLSFSGFSLPIDVAEQVRAVLAEQETPPHRDPERHPPDWNDTGGWLGEQETR